MKAVVLLVALAACGDDGGTPVFPDAAAAADHASISLRRGYWFIPKHVFGLPADVVGGKGSFLPKRLERAALQPLLRLLVGDLTRLGLEKPDHKLFETHPIMNDQLLHHLRHGDIVARRGIASADVDYSLLGSSQRLRADAARVIRTSPDRSICWLSLFEWPCSASIVTDGLLT